MRSFRNIYVYFIHVIKKLYNLHVIHVRVLKKLTKDYLKFQPFSLIKGPIPSPSPEQQLYTTIFCPRSLSLFHFLYRTEYTYMHWRTVKNVQEAFIDMSTPFNCKNDNFLKNLWGSSWKFFILKFQLHLWTRWDRLGSVSS